LKIISLNLEGIVPEKNEYVYIYIAYEYIYVCMCTYIKVAFLSFPWILLLSQEPYWKPESVMNLYIVFALATGFSWEQHFWKTRWKYCLYIIRM
jgi:hypothetical protein